MDELERLGYSSKRVPARPRRGGKAFRRKLLALTANGSPAVVFGAGLFFGCKMKLRCCNLGRLP